MDTANPDRSRILVVDEDVRATHLFVRLLKEDGFEVETAYDAPSAMGRLLREPFPDVLVTDVHTKAVNGFAVAHYARERLPGLPIFMITGHPELIRAHTKTLDPVPQVFTKPIDYALLTMELLRLLARI